MNNCAAALDGGVDDLGPARLWDIIVKKNKVAEMCNEELARLEAKKDLTKKESVVLQQAQAIAEATEALSKLHGRETMSKLREFASKDRGGHPDLVIDHSKEFLRTSDPHFWFSCFVRLFPRGDCLENNEQRTVPLPKWRWAKCLLTRLDFPAWSQDVEFVASLYNIQLRRDQMNAIEAHLRSPAMSEEDLKGIQELTSAGLIACALSSGEVNSVRQLLKKRGLAAPIEKAFRNIQISQRTVRGSEEEKDNLLPKFMALRIWSGCSSIFFTLNPHDIRSPLTLTLLHGYEKFEHTFSLDMTDEELHVDESVHVAHQFTSFDWPRMLRN